VAYHVVSMRLQVWLARRSSSLLPFVAVLGFIIRLAIVAAILVMLGLWAPLNIIAVCLTFVVVFTVLNGISIYFLLTKRHGAARPTDASGAR
jgi:hypothetical protein